MYETMIPIHGRTLTKENRSHYLSHLHAVQCTSIILVPFRCDSDEALSDLADHVAYFTENGIETGLWVGATIGHGHGALVDPSADAPQYAPLVNLDGKAISGTRCPLDETFRADISAYIARLASTGAKTILLDDDFRLSRREGGVLCCACERHMEEIRRLTGNPTLTREEFRRLAFTGERNVYRDAWLTAQGDSLRLLAKDLRKAVDPSVRLALCSVHSHLDPDGVDGLELAKILAGNHPPLLRLHGAPYWAVVSSDKDLLAVFEIARMFASFCPRGEAKLLAEGDVYPRPCYNVPASYLELFDAVIRADGKHDGILKYMVDYFGSPSYETGYLAHHMHDRQNLEEISRMFHGGANLGVRIHVAPHRLRNADLDLDPPSDQSPYPGAGVMLQAAGIPTLYEGKGFTDAVVGEEGRYIDPAACENGMILDAVSAVLLTRRGIDVGLREIGEMRERAVTALTVKEPYECGTVHHGRARILRAEIAPDALPLEYAVADGEECLFAYQYENADGQKFLVCLCGGNTLRRSNAIFAAYVHRTVLHEGIKWLTGKPLPLTLPQSPALYTLVKDDEEKQLRTVLLCNCSADSIIEPRIYFDKKPQRSWYLGIPGEISGNAVVLDSPLPAFSFTVLKIRF